VNPGGAPLRVIAQLGTAQTLAWASSFYLPAMLAEPMARGLGLGTTAVFAAFSAAMLLAAVVGPWAGRTIDRWGGRPVLMASNGLFAAGLAGLALAQDGYGLLAAWLVIGLAMGSGLYEAAFAGLVRLYGVGARNAISGITLFAGFASTVGWPLSAALEASLGWRGACLSWAALHMLIGLPLNTWLPRAAPLAASVRAASAARVDAHGASPADGVAAEDPAERARRWRQAVVLAFVFAATWFVATAMASHLPRVLQASGASLTLAVGAAALVGPAQVAGRLIEMGWLRRLHPLLSARLAAFGHPLAVALLALLGPIGAWPFAVLHGAGNGIMTIAKGTLPLALFGPRGYGAMQGWLMAPTRVAQAGAPLAFGWCLERWGLQALWLTAGLGVAALAALLALRHPAPGSGEP